MKKSFREDYKSYPTPALVLIASSDPSTYRMESIKAAQDELLARGESWEDEQVVADARRRATEGEVDRSLTRDSLVKVALIFLPFFAIPVCLVVVADRKKVLKWGGIGLLCWIVLFLFLVRFGFY